MPGQFSAADLTPPPSGPPASGRFSAADVDAPPSGFITHLASTLASAPGAIMQTVAHPLDALKAWRDQSQALHDAAVDSAEKGDYVGAAAHGFNFLANIVPGLGKTMDDAATAGGESGITSDEFKSKLGDVVGTALLMKAAEKLPTVVSGAKTAASVISDPAVVGAAVKILPKGQAGLDLVDAVRKSTSKTEPVVAPAPIDPLLDQIAQSTSGKKFAALDPAAQATVQKIADAANQRSAAPAGPPPPQSVPPPPPPEAAPPASPAPTPPPPEAPAAPAAAVPPKVAMIPAAEHPGAVDFAAKARAARDANVGPVADTLEKAGFTAELAKQLPPQGWLSLSKAADGPGVSIPPKLRQAVISELESRAAARDLANAQQGTQAAADAAARAEATRRETMIAPSAAYAQALQRPGVLEAAQALADEMNGAASPGKKAFAAARAKTK